MAASQRVITPIFVSIQQNCMILPLWRQGKDTYEIARILSIRRESLMDPKPPFWTDERIAEMTDYWMQGYSASQVAVFIGAASRCSILGKVHRLGLNPVPLTRKKSVPRKPPRPYKPRLRIVSANGNSSQIRVFESIESEPLEMRCAEVIPLNVSLLDLEPGACRYPYGDGPFTFCGQPASGSYCPGHRYLTHVETRVPLTREERLEKHREYNATRRLELRAEQRLQGKVTA